MPVAQPTPTAPVEAPAVETPAPAVAAAAPTPSAELSMAADIGTLLEPEPVSLETAAEPEADEFEGEDDEEVQRELSAVADMQGGTRGNWYKKQQAVKRAHEAYQEVRKYEAQVTPHEQAFLNKKNEFQNKVEEFSNGVGIAMGQLDQIIADYIAYFDAQRKTEGVMSEADRLQLTDLNEKKLELERLKKDFDAVRQSRAAIDQAIATLMQQLSLCHEYEQQAFEKYEKVAHVLSDQVAEQLHVEIKTLGENIQAIDLYIKNEFSTYFDALLAKANEQITTAQATLQSLKDKGINLAVSPTARQPQAPAPEKPAAPAKTTSGSWLSWLWTSVVTALTGTWSWIMSYFR